MNRLLLFLLLYVPAWAIGQNHFKGVLKSVAILEKDKLPKSDSVKVGGLSAIEYYENGKKKGEPANWLLVSDWQAKENRSSYIFQNRSISGPFEGLFSNHKKMDGLENVESVRYHPRLNKLFFALEGDIESKIVFFNKKQKVETLFTEKNTTTNRGIEGLTFTPNNDMWFAFESSSCTDCDEKANIIFKKVAYRQNHALGYDPKKMPVEYTYEIDPCSCIRSLNKPFGDVLGNGISEILALDDMRILVLERCYDGQGRGSNVKLFIGTIDDKRRKIIKGLPIFDFNKISDYKPSGAKGTLPDNLEGMTWGPKDKDGKRLLYLIADDNHNTSDQATQLFMLSIDVTTGATEPAKEVDREVSPIENNQTKVADTVCAKFLNDIPQEICYPSSTKSQLTIDFGSQGSIISKMPAVVLEGEAISITVEAVQPVPEKTTLGKAFQTAIGSLNDSKSESEVLKMIGLRDKKEAGREIEAQFEDFFKPYINNIPPITATLNDADLNLHWVTNHYEGTTSIVDPADERGKQTLLLVQNKPENQFFKDVFRQSKSNYHGWLKYKNTFEKLHEEYAQYARKIDELVMKRELLTEAGKKCQCPKYTGDELKLNETLCLYLKKIKISETQLCAIAAKVIEDNRCWMRSWLWYTSGKPRLNPFPMVSVREFNVQVERRLAEYEELLSFYHDFARQCREEQIQSLVDQLREPISQLTSEIVELKRRKLESPKTEVGYQAWLANLAVTKKTLNRTLLYSTGTGSGNGTETIHWMNHYDASDDYIKMNKPKSLPERVYERDLVHGLVHNLNKQQKVSAKETVTAVKLRSELDIQFDPIVEAFGTAVTVGKSTRHAFAEQAIPEKQVDKGTSCEEDLARYRKSKILIDWLNDQTEPPIEDLEAAYNSFDSAEAEPSFHSQETLVGESRTAEGTNIISYEIFEEGEEKAVVKDKYQTYETIRWWPFVSINYVFGSRSTSIFDKTTGAFAAYTDIDNFEIFTGAKWYLKPSNVTRTHKRTRFISETVGSEYNPERGNGPLSKTFLFIGLGVRHNFLKNYGGGIGFDLVPGFSAQAGVNLYFRKKYELVNGIVKKEFDIPNTRYFIGLSVDANIVTRFISLF